VTRRTTATTRRTYVVEHYRPGLNGEELRHQAEKVRDVVVDMARCGEAIRYLSSTVVSEDDYFQSVLEAASLRLVKDAHTRAGISYERISVGVPIGDVDEV
jgi:hypothetical protein